MKQAHKMRTVTREFVAYPVAFMHHPELRREHIQKSFVELDCGHIKRDPAETYGNETAVRVATGCRALAQLLAPETVKPRRCRCYECGRNL